MRHYMAEEADFMLDGHPYRLTMKNECLLIKELQGMKGFVLLKSLDEIRYRFEGTQKERRYGAKRGY